LHDHEIFISLNAGSFSLSKDHVPLWGTGIRGLMRGMATLPQGNQELLVVKDKLEDPQVSLG